MKLIGLDCEFFNSNEEIMDVVAACLADEKPKSVSQHLDYNMKFNMLDEDDKSDFISRMQSYIGTNTVLVSFAVIAEARSLLSLGIDPLQFQWIDLYVEFIMLCNSNNKYKHGEYIDSSGNVAFSIPVDMEMTEEEKEKDTADHTITPKNLINCAFKMLGERLDAKEKDAMRDLILSKNLSEIRKYMKYILDYCESDTKHLIPIYYAIKEALEKEGLRDFTKDQLSRGRYAVAVAKSESLGIPIDTVLLDKLIKKTPQILEMHEKEVNSFFPFFVPETTQEPKTFKNGRVHHYKPVPKHKDMGAYQTYVESLKIEGFPKTTKSGKYKSDRDTLEEWGYWKGLEALWKYNKTESSLKWFNKDNKNGFFDRLGSDNKIRPYYGIFGTQTGRNAAKAKTFPFAMSSWLRAIVSPENKKQTIICADFSQQEIYVAALLSEDQNLLNAYKSGDVYLAFAKQAGLVPDHATKETHKLERMLCKSTVLGIQFGMGADKLQTKLRLDSGHDVSKEKTLELIEAHKNTYRQYWQWIRRISDEYKQGVPLVTNDGFVLFTDNQVATSVRNYLVQGNAASITRLAVVRCWEMGLKVLCSLHDAIYLLSEHPDIDQDALVEIMKYATEQILKEKEGQTYMRVDTKLIEYGKVWVEEKGEKDWNKLKEFLL
jgi:DNA polymerase-1